MSVPDPLLSSLERLNYFNGQRLEASDFRAEQAYHIAVRRALSRSLFSPGIASGLEVEQHPTDKHRVIVMPGLAIDAQGREIILLEPRDVLARGSPGSPTGLVLGNYLVISYHEAKAASVEDGCRVDAGASLCLTAKRSCSCGGSSKKGGCSCGGGRGDPADTGLAWGGMSRIRAEPILDFQNVWPAKSSGKIVLAQLNLNAQCQVVDVRSGMRQYTLGKQAPKVRALSLEGEKDIDHDNPKVLFFQVEGANPQAVTLHLWATRFSSLYYTELGKHHHDVTGTTDKFDHDFTHSHTIKNGKTDGAGGHMHDYLSDHAGDRNFRVLATSTSADFPDLYDSTFHAGDLAAGFSGQPNIRPVLDHGHTLALDNALGPVSHDHKVTGLAHDAGDTTLLARDGKPPLGFIGAMKVALDGTDITPLILAHLEGLSPGDWAQLGDGTATHALASSAGTGGVDLKQLGIELPLGAHKLVFSVPANAGGQLHYNLYVE